MRSPSSALHVAATSATVAPSRVAAVVVRHHPATSVRTTGLRLALAWRNNASSLRGRPSTARYGDLAAGPCGWSRGGCGTGAAVAVVSSWSSGWPPWAAWCAVHCLRSAAPRHGGALLLAAGVPPPPRGRPPAQWACLRPWGLSRRASEEEERSRRRWRCRPPCLRCCRRERERDLLAWGSDSDGAATGVLPRVASQPCGAVPAYLVGSSSPVWAAGPSLPAGAAWPPVAPSVDQFEM